MARHAKQQPGTLAGRCAEQIAALEAEAAETPPGPKRDEIMGRAREIKVAANMERWLSSPGLQPPT